MRLQVSESLTRISLEYKVIIAGDVLVCFSEPTKVPGFGDQRKEWELPVKTLLQIAKV